MRSLLSYMAESLADLASGKGERVRTVYPKTNFKRYVDQWNDRLGSWVASAHDSGHAVRKRLGTPADQLIIDVIDDNDQLISTAVVTGDDDMKSGDHTFDFYNQTAINDKFRVVPNDTKYDPSWNFAPITGDNLHQNDTFNQPNSAKRMSTDRVRDGGARTRPNTRSITDMARGNKSRS